MGTISSTPYRWPFDADLRSDNTALVVIDMQATFCKPGAPAEVAGLLGWVHRRQRGLE